MEEGINITMCKWNLGHSLTLMLEQTRLSPHYSNKNITIETLIHFPMCNLRTPHHTMFLYQSY